MQTTPAPHRTAYGTGALSRQLGCPPLDLAKLLYRRGIGFVIDGRRYVDAADVPMVRAAAEAAGLLPRPPQSNA